MIAAMMLWKWVILWSPSLSCHHHGPCWSSSISHNCLLTCQIIAMAQRLLGRSKSQCNDAVCVVKVQQLRPITNSCFHNLMVPALHAHKLCTSIWINTRQEVCIVFSDWLQHCRILGYCLPQHFPPEILSKWICHGMNYDFCRQSQGCGTQWLPFPIVQLPEPIIEATHLLYALIFSTMAWK